MHPTQRRDAVNVLARLLAAPQEFEFVQAVAILLRWLEEQGVPNERAWRECLRFENSLDLGFPASEIAHLRIAQGAGETGNPQVQITPPFMGLLGCHGTLPLHYTERIQQWQSLHGDEAPRAFLDILSGRMLALYYEAWRKNRAEQLLTGPADSFKPRLLAIAGTAGAVPDTMLAHFAGLLQQRPRSAAALQHWLAGYFGLPLVVEETVGHWNRMTVQEQSGLGADACLGRNTILGERNWRPDLRARLRFGPLTRTQFARLLPNGDLAMALKRLLVVFDVPAVDFEIQLVLGADEVQPIQLLADTTCATARLGRDSFLVSCPVAADRADMRYVIRSMAPLQEIIAKRPRCA